MWNEVLDKNDLQCFMSEIGYFHDSCIKEMRYLSGAYTGVIVEIYLKMILKITKGL